MAGSFILWHKEYAREGREFDDDTQDPNALARDGWVDSPAKIGINIWNPGDPATDEMVATTQKMFEANQLKAVDETPTAIDPARAAEEDAKRKKVEDREKEFESMRTKLSTAETRAQKAEEELDRVNDAQKKAGASAKRAGKALDPDATAANQKK